jgi:hypothetical protein
MHFADNKVLLRYSQEVTNSPYPEPYEFNPHPKTDFPEIQFNIILPPMNRSLEPSLHLRI